MTEHEALVKCVELLERGVGPLTLPDLQQSQADVATILPQVTRLVGPTPFPNQ